MRRLGELLGRKKVKADEVVTSLVTGTWKGPEVVVWDVGSGKPVRTLPTVKATTGTASVAFSPDGKWLVTGGPGNYRFWSVGSWERGLVISRDHEMEGPAPLAFSHRSRLCRQGSRQLPSTKGHRVCEQDCAGRK